MNRLDTAQIEMPVVDTRLARSLVPATYLVAGAATASFLAWGISEGHNPVDQTFLGLAKIPLGLVVLDVWIVLLALLRREAPTPLRIPFKTPCILAVCHLLFGLLAGRLSRFESLYELVWVGERLGAYQVLWAPATGIVLLTLVSILLSGFEIRLARWVLISEVTSAPPAARTAPAETEDVALGAEHLYEAQVLLNNLGYEVGTISGEMNDATTAAIRQFQGAAGLEVSGALTVKTMIDLRNRWREEEDASNPVKAVSEHAARRTWSRIAGLFKRQ